MYNIMQLEDRLRVARIAVRGWHTGTVTNFEANAAACDAAAALLFAGRGNTFACRFFTGIVHETWRMLATSTWPLTVGYIDGPRPNPRWAVSA